MKVTPTTATLSEAVAVIVVCPETAAPAAGAVRDTSGGVVSGPGALFTVTLTVVEVALFPAASRASALRV